MPLCLGRRWDRCGIVLLCLFACVSSTGAQSSPRYVLVLSSFEQQFSPHNVFDGVFRKELTLRSPGPVQFIDVSLPSTQSGEEMQAKAALEYLNTTFAVHRPDLIVSIGGVAALFAQRHREQIFPDTPMLFSSVDQRFVRNSSFRPNEAAVSVAIDEPLLIENVLRLLPETTTLAVVVGASELEDAWRDDFLRAFEPFKQRLQFVWFNGLSFEEMLKRSASLPQHSAILFAHLAIDAHGVRQVEERALPELRAVANAPIFGGYTSQLGHGIVGGPLLALDDLGRNAATIALRILQGESPQRLTPPPQTLSTPTYDAAELKRWRIAEERLPAGSIVVFREPSVWQLYRVPIVATVSIGLIETALVLGLLMMHVKRRRAERLVQESEERFRLLADTAPVMIWMADKDNKCTDFNRAWLEFTGRTRQEELGDGWADGIHEEDLERYRRTSTTALRHREFFDVEYRLRRVDGEYRWIRASGVPRFDSDGGFVGYTGSATDMTEHKLARAALSNLSQKLMQAHEEERTWIARELHDDINQRVAMLASHLDKLVRKFPYENAAMSDALTDLAADARELGTDIEAISRRLHSSKLEYLGLPAAAAAFCRELSEQQNVAIGFRHDRVPGELRKETALALFRVLQEAVMNAVRHSGARHVDVALCGYGNELHLDVIDNGTGFDPKEIVGDGLGLVSMRERLHLIDGELVVESRPGAGTRIHARVRNPLSEPGTGGQIVNETDPLSTGAAQGV